MNKMTLWDKVKDLIYYLIWRLYCGFVLKMSDEKYCSLNYCPFCQTSRENWKESEEEND